MSSLDFLVWLQSLRVPFLDNLFIGLSALGSEEAYMALLAFAYLCVGHRIGFHLVVLFLATSFSNGLIKQAIGTVRPFEQYPEQITPLYPESGGGPSFPSGHAQNAAVVWGFVALRIGSSAERIAALLLIAGIAFSRLWLGVHWPIDVLGGLIIGGLILLAYLFVLGAWKASGRKLEFANSVVLVIAASGLMYIAGQGIEACVRSAGVLLGAGVGFILLERRGYSAHAPRLTQAFKLLVAVVVLLGLRIGLKAVLGDSGPADYVRYAALGFALTYLLPTFFTGYYKWRMRLRRALELIDDDTPEPMA